MHQLIGTLFNLGVVASALLRVAAVTRRVVLLLPTLTTDVS
jgi:hypothetical protein